jgi:4'-phosphopantetheinyl transferase
MQKLYFIRIKSLAALVKPLTLQLNAERREKMHSYRKEDDRLRCLAGGLLLEGVTWGRKLHFTEYGKPFLPEGPFFNLSHSGDVVCLAVSAISPIGADVEEWRDEDVAVLAKTAFHPEEQAFFFEDPTVGRFYELWTLKESYIKMIGTGFSLGSVEFCVLPWREPASAPCRGAVGGGIPEQFSCHQRNRFRPEGHTCFFRRFDLSNDYSLSVCAEAPLEIIPQEVIF